MNRTRIIWIVLLVVLLAAPVAYFVAAGARLHTSSGAALALDAPLPDKTPPGTKLIIGDPMTQQVLAYTGWGKDLPFQIQWAQMTGGPAVTEAFHAHALDVGLSADIPPIHAVWVGIPVRAIAVGLRRDPLNHPTYVLAISPKANISSLADLRGKRIAFSPGQVQGEVVLRTLQGQGLSKKDVTLVEMPSTSVDVYINALVAGVVDVAPIGAGIGSRHYLAQFGRDGAKVLKHGAFRDDYINLYVRTDTLQDPAKAAALREYVKLWGRVQAWIQSHPGEWAHLYYAKTLGMPEDDARYVVSIAGDREIPSDWGPAIAQQQNTIDLMARETGRKRFDAASLFDRRFEHIAAQAFAAAAPSQTRLASTAP